MPPPNFCNSHCRQVSAPKSVMFLRSSKACDEESGGDSAAFDSIAVSSPTPTKSVESDANSGRIPETAMSCKEGD